MEQLPPSVPAQQAPAKQPVVLPEHHLSLQYQIQQYGTAVFVAAPFMFLFSIYSFYRGGTYDLAVINMVLSDTAAVLLGFVLLLGPLSRMFNMFDKYVQYRKELGVTVFWLTLAHAVVSFFFLSTRYTISTYLTTRLWPFLFGSAGLVMLTALFLSSREKIKAKLGPHRWWKFQNWGVRSVLLFTTLHLGFANMNSWIRWYQHGSTAAILHPEWPSTSIFIAWYLAFVILIRLIEPLDKQWGKMAWYAMVILLPAIYLGTCIWGAQFIK